MMRQFGAIQCRRFIYLCSRQHVIKSCCPHILELEVQKNGSKNRKGLKQEIVNLFPVRLRQILEALPLDFARLEEIRLRCGQPILFRIAGKEMGITGSGDLTELGSSGKLENWEKLEKIREKELKDTLEIMGGFSLYAAEEELRQGFFTVRGGHRIGVAGRVILKDRQITGLKAASFLNVRVAHEIKGCADQVLPFLYVNGKFVSTLIVSPPGCGKTTLLRDLIRQVSDGSSQKAGKCSFAGVNVGVADERSELGACYQGVPQNDLGMRTDVLDGCPKSEGMLMLIRSMAPAVVAVDEIGGKEDIKAVEYVRNCGCALAATAHGNSLEELKERAGFRELLEEKTFERLVFLSRKRECRGKVEVVYDSGFNRLYSGRIF